MKTKFFFLLFLLILVANNVLAQENATTVQATPSSPKSSTQTEHPTTTGQQMSFWEIINDLREGNNRFVQGKMTHAKQDEATRKELITSQHPKTIILSCSDSRVPAELIFDKGIGEIFVIRNAGNIVDTVALASIEYAIEHLGAQVLIIMGHDSCGAVKATLSAKNDKSSGSTNIDFLIKKINENLSFTRKVSRDPNNPTDAIKANVRGVVINIMKRSKIVREFVENNKLMIAQSYYHFDTGVAEFLEVGRPLLIENSKTENGKIESSENAKATSESATH